MAKRQVFEVICDRCHRTETQPLQAGQDNRSGPELEMTYRGKKVLYQDLCMNCQKAVENYITSLTKSKEKDETAKPEPEVKSGFLGLGGGNKRQE